MPGCTTRGSWETLGKYTLNTPAVNLELARMISAFPGIFVSEDAKNELRGVTRQRDARVVTSSSQSMGRR
jgi:hypothetical protein